MQFVIVRPTRGSWCLSCVELPHKVIGKGRARQFPQLSLQCLLKGCACISGRKDERGLTRRKLSLERMLLRYIGEVGPGEFERSLDHRLEDLFRRCPGCDRGERFVKATTLHRGLERRTTTTGKQRVLAQCI